MTELNLNLIIPQLFLFGWAILVLLIDFFKKGESRKGLGYFSLLGLALTAVLVMIAARGEGFYGTFVSDDYGGLFNIIFILSAMLTILASVDFAEMRLKHKGEFYGLLLFAVVGMMFLSGANELVTLYVSLELATIPLYVMAAYLKKDLKSTEAGLKYVIIGGASSAILLFGISLLYGLSGTTFLADIQSWNLTASNLKMGLGLGIVMLVAGFGFKLAAAPFHMWAPDVYEGAPTPVTAFLSVASKAAGLVAFVRIFFSPLIIAQTDWVLILEIVAVMAMVIGNFVALLQTNIKRMLAYSSIAQVGYVLVALCAGNGYSIVGMMIFLMAYVFANIGAFMVAIGFYNMTGSDQIRDYAGMIRRNPLASVMMTIFMLSLVGIPPTAGFLGKYWLFAAAVKGHLYWLVVVAVLASVVSLFYYINVVRIMMFRKQDDESRIYYGPALGLGILISGIMVILICVLPSTFFEMASRAVKAFFPEL
jgi:NADH-quinone oxidoreductase subunit N